MWAYDLNLWPWRSPRLSVIRVLVLCYSTKCKFWWCYDYSFSIYGPLGQHGSDWLRDFATLAFDLGGHGTCSWCMSSFSISIPSLKLVGLAVRKIWRTMFVSINGPGDPDLWPFDLETGVRIASKMGNLPQNLGTLGLWVLELFAMYATDGQTDGQTDGRTTGTLIAPFSTGAGA